jgi:hypothetical protein
MPHDDLHVIRRNVTSSNVALVYTLAVERANPLTTHVY